MFLLLDIRTGQRCETSIPKQVTNLTIGQKLLKEPIWIGMIVMLNLLLFFCVTYVVRRKCGHRILQLFPNSSNKSGIASKGKGDEASKTLLYSLYSRSTRGMDIVNY